MTITYITSASTLDGQVACTASTLGGYTYADVRDGVDAGTAQATTATTEDIGQQYSGTFYTIYRLFLAFDTSEIPDNATITSASLRLVASADNSATDFDVNIIKSDWSSATSASAKYDVLLAGTEDNSIWRNTSGMSINTQYTSGGLDTTWVNKTGYTYYGILSNRDFDGSGTAPTGDERIFLYMGNYTSSGSRPTLIVEYSTGYTLTCDSASFSLSGTNTELKYSRILPLTNGDFELSGTVTNLEYNRILPLAGDTFSFTGTDIIIRYGLNFSLDSGSFSVTGTDLDIFGDYILLAESSSFSLTGNDSGIFKTFYLNAEKGGFILTPVSLNFLREIIFSFDNGIFSFTGTNATIRRDVPISLESAIFSLSMTDASVLKKYILSLDSGIFILNENPIVFYNRIPGYTTNFYIDISGELKSFTLNFLTSASIVEDKNTFYIDTETKNINTIRLL